MKELSAQEIAHFWPDADPADIRKQFAELQAKLDEEKKRIEETDLVYRLRKRAEIRRQIPSRKSVKEGAPDRIADLLDEAADEIIRLRADNAQMHDEIITANGDG